MVDASTTGTAGEFSGNYKEKNMESSVEMIPYFLYS